MEIIIKDKTFQLTNSIRGHFYYERIVGETFKPDNIFNEYILFFCFLLACNPDFSLTFDEFINECDSDKTLFPVFQQWFVEELRKTALLVNEKEKEIDSKKKT